MTPLLLVIGSLSLGAIRRLLIVCSPLKCTCIPYLLHAFDSLAEALMIWNHHAQVLIDSVSLALLIVYSSLFCSIGVLALQLCSVMAHMGYLHFLSVLNRCCSSSCNKVGSEHMVFALWYRVPATLYLDGILWWLSHCRYRSV